MKRGLPLSVRIIGIGAILVAVTLVVMTILITGQVNQGIMADKQHELRQSVELAGRYVGALVESVSETVLPLAHDLDRTAEDEVRGLLAEGARQNPFIRQLLVIDRGGRLLAASDGPMAQASLTAANLGPAIAAALADPGRAAASRAFRPSAESPIVYASIAAIGARTGGENLLVAIVDLDAIFKHSVGDQVYGKEGYAFFGETSGMMLSHPSKPFTDQRGQVFMDAVTKGLAAGTVSDIVPYPWEGRSKQLAYRAIEKTPFFVAATVWDDDLFALANSIANTLILVGIIALASIIAVLAFSIVAFVTRPLSRLTGILASNADSLESASQQISASSEQLSSGSSELAASVEEISASLEELESVVELNTKNINESELLMRDTSEGAQKVSAQMAVLSEALREIGASSDEIVNITGVIEDIAFQTNILALNAAVEAGRAGEAGKGFSVVADQVKDLAQKSSAAAKETTKLIQKAIRNIERGQNLGNEVSEIQKKAAHMAGQVSTLLDEVNRASQEQMKGIRQITVAITQTNSVVQQTAASAEETAAASEELYGQAEELNTAVGTLNRLVSGSAERAKSSAPADARAGRGGKARAKPEAPAEPASRGGRAAIRSSRPASARLADKTGGSDAHAGGFDPESIIPLDDDIAKL